MAKKDIFNLKATPDGGLWTSDYNRQRMKVWLKENAGIWLQLKPLRDESSKMRRFFEGAVVPLMTYYREDMDYHNPEDLETMRNLLKVEFNGQMAMINGKSHIIPKSTKGSDVLPDFIERVIAWADEQGYQTELLDNNAYKIWNDTIRGYGEIDSYIDYLKSIKRLI